MNMFFRVLGLLLGVIGMSCADDEPQVVEPVFPESRRFEMSPGEIREVAFEANMAWSLSSNNQWLKFIDDLGEFQSLSGKAGEHVVKFRITDGGHGFTADVASAELAMGGKKQMLIEIARPAKSRVVTMYTARQSGSALEFVPIEELVCAAYDRFQYIGFEANFDWKVDAGSVPEWLSDGSTMLPIRKLNGDAGQKIDFNRLGTVIPDSEIRYEDRAGFITIRDQASDYTCQFPVSAPGVPEGAIKWLNNAYDLMRGFHWNNEGQQMKYELANGSYYPVDEPVVCKFLIRNNAYDYRLVEWKNGHAVEIGEAEAWVKIASRDKGNITLSAEVYDDKKDRSLAFFAVPEGVDVDYGAYFSPTGVFEFKTDGFGVALRQFGKSGGFEVWKRINSMKTENMDGVVKAADAQDIASKLHLTVVNNIYERTFTAQEWDLTNMFNLVPLGIPGNWAEEGYTYELYNSRFQSMGVKPTGWSRAGFFEMGTYDANWSRIWSVNIKDRIPFEEVEDTMLYIVLRDGTGKDLGTFVIRKG